MPQFSLRERNGTGVGTFMFISFNKLNWLFIAEKKIGTIMLSHFQDWPTAVPFYQQYKLICPEKMEFLFQRGS